MKKNLIILALAIITIVSTFGAVMWKNELKKSNQSLENLVMNNGKNAEVTRYVVDSIEHVVFKQTTVKDVEAEKRLAITKSYADSLERALKMSIKKIDAAYKVNAQLNDQIKLKQQAGALAYQDKYLNISFNKESDSLNFSYDLALNFAKYSKKKGLFSKKQKYIHVFSDDPRVTIKGLKSFEIAETPPKRFGIGISAGYGFTVNNNVVTLSPYAGLSLNYNLIQF